MQRQDFVHRVLTTVASSYANPGERAAARGLAKFKHGYWIKTEQFQQVAMYDLDTSQPRIHFGRLRNWLAGIGGVAEDLEHKHGRAAVEFLRLVVSMTARGGTLERLLDGVDGETTTLLLEMIELAAGRTTLTHDGPRVPADFPAWEHVALYAPPADRERFVVVLAAGWDERTSSGEVKTPHDAVAATLGLMVGPGSGDTTLHVHDRETGELHRVQLNEIARSEHL